MDKRLIRDRIKWGSVVAMGLFFSLFTTEENVAERTAIPDKAEERRDQSSKIKLESPCTSSFLISHG